MDFIVLDEQSRTILRLWLSGREHPYQITYQRWADLKSESTDRLGHDELAEIIDLYGHLIFDLLMLPQEDKASLIVSMKLQYQKDNGMLPSTDVRRMLQRSV